MTPLELCSRLPLSESGNGALVHKQLGKDSERRFVTVARALVAVVVGLSGFVGSMLFASSTPAGAAVTLASTAGWCSAHGSNFVGWVGLDPDVPICGPGPDYGGGWSDVALPGPYGVMGTYYNATPGFQCVELAERYLAVADGLAPVHANGGTVALNYHLAYPRTILTVNRTPGAVGHAPVAGDVVSFSSSPSFTDGGDGHVAVVVRSAVNAKTGNGVVLIAQENVGSSDYQRTLTLAGWRLEDPQYGDSAEFQFGYAEWLNANALRSRSRAGLVQRGVGPGSEPLLGQPGISAKGAIPVSVLRAPLVGASLTSALPVSVTRSWTTAVPTNQPLFAIAARSSSSGPQLLLGAIVILLVMSSSGLLVLFAPRRRGRHLARPGTKPVVLARRAYRADRIRPALLRS